jgi:hypothetical protein
MVPRSLHEDRHANRKRLRYGTAGRPHPLHRPVRDGPSNALAPAEPARFPASILSQIRALLGIHFFSEKADHSSAADK